MRTRIERLRLALLVGAGLLVAVLAGTIGTAHYVRKHMVKRLSDKLGLHVKTDSHGFTYSPSKGGRNQFLLRAAHEEETDDGKLRLHGVEITLYGARGDRQDHISGDEFEYDTKAGVLRAIGVVHIDLQAAESKPQGAGAAQHGSTGESGQSAAAKVLHATTSGLIYNEKLGIAVTQEEIDFQLGAMSGQAKGADYNADGDELLLHSAVRMKGIAGGRPVSLTADTADLMNRERKTLLTRARYVSLGETAEAQRATIVTRVDGSLESVEADGSVVLGDEGSRMTADRGVAKMNAKGQAESAVLTGSVRYALDEALVQRRGEGAQADIAFDDAGRVRHAVFTGSVHMTERTRATEAEREPWSVRDLTAAKVDTVLVPAGAKRAEIENVEAAGSARLTVVDNGNLAKPKGAGRTDLSGDVLRAHMVPGAAGKPELETVAGRGHTVVHQLREDGTEQTSRGDTLDAKMRRGISHGGGGAGRTAAAVIESAVQEGHVSVAGRSPAKDGKAEDVREATAERAVYDGGTDRVTLTGSKDAVELKDAESQLWANTVVLEHATGDAHAEGGVKVSYLQSPTAGKTAKAHEDEPVHFLADRAEMVRAKDTTTFYGSAGRMVRMWQGGSQVEAPVIEMEKAAKRMKAHGDGAGGDAGQVRTLLVGAGSVASASAKTKPVQAVRILSRELVYEDGPRTAEFTGGVRMLSADGTMTAREATAYLTPADAGVAKGADAKGGVSFGGGVDRVVAVGAVVIEQPGRRATGDRLVYIASDATYVLTGDKGALVKVVDEEQGTTVATEARLHRADERVEFVGAGERVRTESPAKAMKPAKGEAKR